MLAAAVLIFLTFLTMFGTWNTMLASSRVHGFAFCQAAGYTLLVAAVLTALMLGVLAVFVVG